MVILRHENPALDRHLDLIAELLGIPAVLRAVLQGKILFLEPRLIFGQAGNLHRQLSFLAAGSLFPERMHIKLVAVEKPRPVKARHLLQPVVAFHDQVLQVLFLRGRVHRIQRKHLEQALEESVVGAEAGHPHVMEGRFGPDLIIDLVIPLLHIVFQGMVAKE